MISLRKGLPKQTIKKTLKSLEKLNNELMNPYKVLAVLKLSFGSVYYKVIMLNKILLLENEKLFFQCI